MNTQVMPTGPEWFGHPRGLFVCFATEMWERFSYYGMRALLVLFMTASITDGGLAFDDIKATSIYGLYTAAVYLATLPGGWIADRIIGAQRSVLYGGITIMCGHFVLAIPAESTFPTPRLHFPDAKYLYSGCTDFIRDTGEREFCAAFALVLLNGTPCRG